MSDSLTEEISQKCDRLNQECDGLFDRAFDLDIEVEKLNASANTMVVQIGLLGSAQVDVERRRRALAWRLFWSRFHPVYILDQMSRALRLRQIFRGKRVPPNAQADTRRSALAVPGSDAFAEAAQS